EGVAYTAFNTWKVGSAKGDDGVLLVVAPTERKLRIETGKGVGGALTDVQSSRINRETIGPLMNEGKVYEAVNKGTDAILRELVEGTPGGTSEQGKGPAKKPSAISDTVKFGAGIAITILVIVLAIISPTFRQILFFFLLFGRGGGGGGGGG